MGGIVVPRGRARVSRGSCHCPSRKRSSQWRFSSSSVAPLPTACPLSSRTTLKLLCARNAASPPQVYASLPAKAAYHGISPSTPTIPPHHAPGTAHSHHTDEHRRSRGHTPLPSPGLGGQALGRPDRPEPTQRKSRHPAKVLGAQIGGTLPTEKPADVRRPDHAPGTQGNRRADQANSSGCPRRPPCPLHSTQNPDKSAQTQRWSSAPAKPRARQTGTWLTSTKRSGRPPPPLTPKSPRHGTQPPDEPAQTQSWSSAPAKRRAWQTGTWTTITKRSRRPPPPLTRQSPRHCTQPSDRPARTQRRFSDPAKVLAPQTGCTPPTAKPAEARYPQHAAGTQGSHRADQREHSGGPPTPPSQRHTIQPP